MSHQVCGNGQNQKRCLVCEKEIKIDEHFAHDAGYLQASFHYGSEMDQCLGWPGREAIAEDGTPTERLLACDKMEAFICDDCFRKKYDFFTGYVIKKSVDLEIVDVENKED